MARFKLLLLLAVPLFLPYAPGPWAHVHQASDKSGKVVVSVKDKRIDECSGIAISRSTSDAIWMHNDSGDDPRIFLVSLKTGKTACSVELKGVEAIDWEDICSFSDGGQNWVLIADTGDNQRNRNVRKRRPAACLYLVNEPAAGGKKHKKVKANRVIRFTYEDGPQDCEAIAVDPVQKKILLLSKGVDPRATGLYELPLKPKRRNDVVAKRIADLPVPIATGMDLSSDGLRLMIITPKVGFLIQRKQGEAWAKAGRRVPKAFQLPDQIQCEAVCFAKDSRDVLVTSEVAHQPIWRMRVTDR